MSKTKDQLLAEAAELGLELAPEEVTKADIEQAISYAKDPRAHAASLGLLIPDDWSDDKVQEAVSTFVKVQDEDPPPPRPQERYRPRSPRG